ncbi:MAG: VLRF1 family aeRF1-type release factor [Solirubrobacterales bacterium]
MNLPDDDQLRDLLEWEPDHGVLSLCLRIDPGDRGHGWRIELKDELRAGLKRIGDDRPHEEQQALKATAERVLARYPEDAQPADGRAHIGFVEVSRDGGEERWFTSQAAPRRTYASFGPRPSIRRLAELLDDHRHIGVVCFSGEEARLLNWKRARLEQVEHLEILTTGDWRDTRGQRNYDPASAQTISSSGRDQYDQRVEAHRERFIKGLADKTVEACSEHGWSELMIFGDDHYLKDFSERLPEHLDQVHCEAKNLVPEPDHAIAERIDELVPEINRKRERALIEQAENAARSGGRGSLGLQETAQALGEGRVEHLLIESDRNFDVEAVASVLAYERQLPTVSPGELFIERAVTTGASVTPVEGDAADQLAQHEGIAALLRY